MPRDPRYLGNATGYADRQKSPLAASAMNRASLPEEPVRPAVEYEPHRKDHLFLWTVFLLLLVGFSMMCWIGSYIVFSRPELPVSYRILRKIKKIDLPQRFKVNAAPSGEFLGPEKLYNRYNAMNGPQLRELNRELERAYLRNYVNSGVQVPYVTGRFTILDTFELQPTDFIPAGVVALAVSSDFPRLLIEHIYSASSSQAPLIKHNLQTGMDIELRRTFELTAVLHVARLEDGHIQLTVVPINYGAYEFKGATAGFRLDPPTELHVAAGWPVIRGDRREQSNVTYLDFRTKSGLGPLLVKKEGVKLPGTALVGVDTPIPVESPSPGPVAIPPAQLAKNGTPAPPADGKGNSPDGKKVLPAIAVASPGTTLAKANLPVRAALPVDESPRRAASAQPAMLTAVPPSRGASSGVSLQPFLAPPPAATTVPDSRPGLLASAAPAGAVPGKTWRTYSPGQMPPGKNVHVNEISDLSQRGGLEGEPVYLTGQFVVRAVGENKTKGIKNAVLRSSAQSNVRVIVQYPAELPLPARGFRDQPRRTASLPDHRCAPDDRRHPQRLRAGN